MTSIFSFPLRYLFPVLIICICFSATLVSYITSVEHGITRMEERHQISLRNQLTRAQGVLEAAVHTNDTPGIQRFVSSFGGQEGLDVLMLVNEEGTIVAATSLGMKGGHWRNTNFTVASSLIEAATKAKSVATQLSPDKLKVRGDHKYLPHRSFGRETALRLVWLSIHQPGPSIGESRRNKFAARTGANRWWRNFYVHIAHYVLLSWVGYKTCQSIDCRNDWLRIGSNQQQIRVGRSGRAGCYWSRYR